MINYISAGISPLSIHYLGSHAENEGVMCTSDPNVIEDDLLRELLFKYFLKGFKEPAFSGFSFSSGNISDNPMFGYCKDIFDDPSHLHEHSIRIAKYLHANSKSPNIKAGEIVMCHFTDLLVGDEMLDGVGIFKIESKAHFLKLLKSKNSYNLAHDQGLAIGGLDKGCLVFNTEEKSGFKICTLDRSNKSEAHFWTNDFLNVKEKSDDYHFTKHYMKLTKDFVEDRLRPESGMHKDEEFAIMNASEKFFQQKETFSEKEYVEEVFGDASLDAFDDYKRETSQSRGGMFLQPEFDISHAAVQRHSKVFKSVLKLDKNFSVYVHGDRTKILRGEEPDGRKFYKLYYEEEK